jgi:hypothetical protein
MILSGAFGSPMGLRIFEKESHDMIFSRGAYISSICTWAPRLNVSSAQSMKSSVNDHHGISTCQKGGTMKSIWLIHLAPTANYM